MDHCLGLIGGLGVGATIFYYQELEKARAAAGQPLNLLIAHAGRTRVLQLVRDRQTAQLAAYFAAIVDRLAAAGAAVAAIGAVAPHICIRELSARCALPLVSLIDETVVGIQQRGFHRVALFGTRFVIESSLFGMLPDVEVVLPQAREIDAIHNLYLEVVNQAQGGERQHRLLTALAHELIARERLDAIVLAGTELSLVFNEQNTDFPALDCARLHLDALLRSMPS